jgi:hypothetical protein
MDTNVLTKVIAPAEGFVAALKGATMRCGRKSLSTKRE